MINNLLTFLIVERDTPFRASSGLAAIHSYRGGVNKTPSIHAEIGRPIRRLQSSNEVRLRTLTISFQDGWSAATTLGVAAFLAAGFLAVALEAGLDLGLMSFLSFAALPVRGRAEVFSSTACSTSGATTAASTTAADIVAMSGKGRVRTSGS